MGVIRAGRFSALVPSVRHQGHAGRHRHHHRVAPAAGGLRRRRRRLRHPGQLHPGAALIAVLSLAMLYGWKHTPLGALSADLAGAGGGGDGERRRRGASRLRPGAGARGHYVDVPLGGIRALASALPRPDFSAAMNPAVWITGATDRGRGQHRDAAVGAGGRSAGPAEAAQPAGPRAAGTGHGQRRVGPASAACR